jgi:hypothetical protein
MNVIFNLIITNPIKITALIVAIISFNFADSVKNSTYKKPIVTEFKDEATWVYISRSNNNQSGYEIISSSHKKKLVDNCLILVDYNALNVIFWILFGISSLFFVISVIVGLVTGDTDVSWDLEDCQEQATNSIIQCELEDGVFYYTALGRLIGKSEHQISPQRICDTFKVYSLSNVKKCPKFSTKTEKRNNLLDKLGI